MAIIAAAALADMIDAALTVLAGFIGPATFAATVLQTDLTAWTSVIVGAAADTLTGAAKCPIAATVFLATAFSAAAWLAIIIDAESAEAAVLVTAAGGATEMVDAALTSAAAIGSRTAVTGYARARIGITLA